MPLRDLWDLVDRNRQNIRLLVIANTKSEYCLPDDYDDFSVTTEYLSDTELDQLLGGFRDAGIITDLFVGEWDFLRAVLDRSSSGNQNEKLLAYNTVPSGTWHGRYSLPTALCGFAGVGYCGSNAYAVGVTGNKYYALRLAAACGVATGGFWLYLQNRSWLHGNRPPDGTRIIAKPALESASIGIDGDSVRIVDKALDHWLEQRVDLLRQPLLVQSFVSGYELEVPVFGAGEVFVPAVMGVELNRSRLLGEAILTYDTVFDDEYRYYLARDLDPALADRAAASAIRIFSELGLHGFARFDFRVNLQGEHVVTDINAIPHLTPTSSCALAFESRGMNYSEMLKLVPAAGLANPGHL